MKKKLTMLLAALLACVGAAKAQTVTLQASTNVESPEHQYVIKSGNNYWMAANTGPTRHALGRFAFFAVDETNDANDYKVYSIDKKQWVSYTKAGSYNNGRNFATLVDGQTDAQPWSVEKVTVSGVDYYQLVPYNNTGKAAKYMNFFGGINTSGYSYDGTETIGLWDSNASGDPGSRWVFAEARDLGSIVAGEGITTTWNTDTWWTTTDGNGNNVLQEVKDVERGQYSDKTSNVKMSYMHINAPAGRLEVTLTYQGGNNRLDIVGMDLLDAGGNVLASDYHFGYSGGYKENNTYTLPVETEGDYTLRYWVTFCAESNTSNGNITIEHITVAEMIAELKDAAKTEVDNLSKLSIVSVGDAATQIDAVADNDLDAAEEAINAILVNVKKSLDGKSVKFTNHGSGDRNGRCLGYDNANSRAAAVASTGSDVIWTLKVQEDGSFKMYNFVNNLYLGTPSTAATHTNETDAPSFNLIATDTDKGALVCNNGEMLHIANHTDFKVMSHNSLTDGASLWTIADAGTIVISREQYDAAAAAKAELPFAIHEAYGLVTEASKFSSNAKQENEGSYENLLDNVYGTYFHSSWDTVIGDYHYLQAEVSEEVKEFCFYFKKRSDNNNNRPTEIEVLGSSNGEEFTPITTINTGLPTAESQIDYISSSISASENVRHIRFVVKATNTNALDNQYSQEDPKPEGHPYFTFSEFYIFPATPDVNNLIAAYNAFATTSITSSDITSVANSLVNAETTLALSNIKKEVAAILTANESKHANPPALGQYNTTAYDALNAAYQAGDATQESIEEAIAAFERSLNRPVYFISSAHDDYAAGSAIYYDGTWRWKTANRYDRQMWMTIPGYTEADVPTTAAYDANGTSYEICDYLTNTPMRGKNVQIVEIEGWDDVYNLQYSTTDKDAVMHAQQGGALVGWNPATTTDSKASAWKVEYIGNTYQLDDFTEKQLELLAKLQTEYNAKEYLLHCEFGDGASQYSGDGEAIKNTLYQTGNQLNTKFTVQMSMTEEELQTLVDNISSINSTLNMPKDGKFYRIKSTQGNYITGSTTADGTKIALTTVADASTIYYYKDNKLQAYQSGKFIGLNSGYYLFRDAAASSPAITFDESPRHTTPGAYRIKSDRYFHDGGTLLERCQNDEANNHDWLLEEVQYETANITYSYKFGETECATQEVIGLVGQPYPTPTVVLPFGVTAETPEGTVAQGETTKDIICNDSNLPFKYAATYDEVETNEYWYYLKFDSNNNYYLYHKENQSYISLDSKAVNKSNKDTYSWGFVGDPFNGYQIVNRATGATHILSSSTATTELKDPNDETKGRYNGDNTFPIMTTTPVPEGNNSLWIPTASTHAAGGFFLAQKDHPNNRMNNRGKLAYWTNNAGAGSTFVVEARPFGPVAELEALLVEARELQTTVSENTSNVLGEYSQETADALNAAIETAESKGDAAVAEDVVTLQAAIDAVKKNLPVDGKYYLISSVLFTDIKAVYANGDAPAWKEFNDKDKSFFWQAVATENGGIALKNVGTDKFLHGNIYQSGAWTLGDTPEGAEVDITVLQKGTNTTTGEDYIFGLIVSGWQMHCNGHDDGRGTNGNIVSWNGNAGSASAWKIVEVELPEFYTITYEFTLNGETKVAQTAELAAGAGYPAISDITLPYGISLSAVAPEGEVSGSETHTFVLNVDKELPLEAAESVEGITKWYYAQLHLNPDVTSYIQDNGDGIVEWADKDFDDDEIESHLWGFVGDVFGLKVINKATGRAIVSTSGNAATGDAADATAFFVTGSDNTTEGCFCLQYPGTNSWLNAQDGQIKANNDNDTGSSFLLTAYDRVYTVSVNETAGVGTYYSDKYRLLIPETVTAYVAVETVDNYVTLEQITGVIPAKTGIILEGAGEHEFETSIEQPVEIETNLLRGSVTDTYVQAEANTVHYVLANGDNGVGLYRTTYNKNENGGEGTTHFKNNANKAYLPITVDEPAQAARALVMRFGRGEGGTTAIEPAANGQQTTAIYDLQGRRVLNPTKGMYIVNGKKVIF